jgi:hypothetical protein
MFHIELRHFPHTASRFNLSEDELRPIVIPWVRDQWIEVGERKWNPQEATITILEGPTLEVQELKMGRGWKAAKRRGEDVTERVLGISRQAEEDRAKAQDEARIEEAARAQIASQGAYTADFPAPATAPAGAAKPIVPPPAPSLADPLALGVTLASLLGSQPAQLLAAWQQAASGSPELLPSETLAQAERALGTSGGNPG